MARRRRGFKAPRVSFIMFQDIMTAVTGILILIVILQIIQVTAAPSKESESKAATTAQYAELQQALKALGEAEAEDTILREKLQESDQQNKMETSAVSSLEIAGEIARDKEELEKLQSDVTKEKQAEQGRDASVGLAQDEKNLESSEQQTKTAQERLVAIQQETKSNQKEIQSLEIKLKNAEELQKRLYLIPDEAQTAKEPVVAVVSKDGIEFSRFNHPTDTKIVSDVGNNDAMSQAVGSYTPGDQYFVFYIKPSGVAIFEKLYQIAHRKGFEVGFDAIEEAQQIVLSQPPGSDISHPPTQVTSGSTQGGTNAAVSSTTDSITASSSDATTPGSKQSPGGPDSSTSAPVPASSGQQSKTNSPPVLSQPPTPTVEATGTNQPAEAVPQPEAVVSEHSSKQQNSSGPLPWILIAIAVLIAATLTYFFVRNK